MTEVSERGYLPDLLLENGVFTSKRALFIDPAGMITRVSSAPEDLARAHRLAGCAIVPGLVNVHSHSFQRAIRGRTECRTHAHRDTFWTWREAMYHAAGRLSPEDIYVVARMAFLEMLRSGITAVGEFHYLHHAPDGTPYMERNLTSRLVIEAASEVGIRIALLRTAYARAGWNLPPNPGQRRFLTPSPAQFVEDTEALRAQVRNPLASVGVAPHSVRALPWEYLSEVCTYAHKAGLPLHIHVAEQPAEIEAFEAEHGAAPIAAFAEEGLLEGGMNLVHSIHISEGDAETLGRYGARVCACPTSERNLGDGPVPALELRRRGVGLAFGSDSNVQVDLLEDARLLEYHLRMDRLERAVLAPDSEQDSLARFLFASATVEGAAALSLPTGELAPGMAADFVVLDLCDLSLVGATPDSLLSHIVFSLERTAIRSVFTAGEEVIAGGEHAEQARIVADFKRVQKELWQ